VEIEYSQIVPSSPVNVASYYGWHHLLYEGLAGAYLIPLVLGVYALVEYLRKNADHLMSYIPTIFIFASLFVLWSYLGSGYQPRRLLLFAPFVAFLIVQGVIVTSSLLKTSLTRGFVAFCIFDVLSLGYFWLRYEGIESINLRSFGISNFELIDYYVIASLFVFTMILPRVIDLVLNKLSKFPKLNLQRKVYKTSSILIILALLSQIVLLSGISSYCTSVQEFNGDFNSAQSIENFYDANGINTKYLLGDFTDVISYFGGLSDSYAVLGFYIHYLPV